MELNFLHVSSFIFYMFYSQWKGIFRKKNNSEPKISNSTYSRVPSSFWTSADVLISLMGSHSQTRNGCRMKAKGNFLECFDSHWFSKGRNKKFQIHCCLDLCWVMGQNGRFLEWFCLSSLEEWLLPFRLLLYSVWTATLEMAWVSS